MKGISFVGKDGRPMGVQGDYCPLVSGNVWRWSNGDMPMWVESQRRAGVQGAEGRPQESSLCTLVFSYSSFRSLLKCDTFSGRSFLYPKLRESPLVVSLSSMALVCFLKVYLGFFTQQPVAPEQQDWIYLCSHALVPGTQNRCPVNICQLASELESS
jgi:hypothetical protein